MKHNDFCLQKEVPELEIPERKRVPQIKLS